MPTKKQRIGDHGADQCMQATIPGYNPFQRKINVTSPNAFTNEIIGGKNGENELIIGENEYYDNIIDLTDAADVPRCDPTEQVISLVKEKIEEKGSSASSTGFNANRKKCQSCSCGCTRYARSIGGKRTRNVTCLRLEYPNWDNYFKSEKHRLQAGGDPVHLIQYQRKRSEAEKRLYIPVAEKTEAEREEYNAKARLQYKRCAESIRLLCQKDLQTILEQLEESDEEMLQDILFSLNQNLLRRYHCSPLNYATGPHPIIPGGRGIDVGGFILVNSCHGCPQQFKVWFNEDFWWSLSHTLAHHAEEVIASGYKVKMYALNPTKNAASVTIASK